MNNPRNFPTVETLSLDAMLARFVHVARGPLVADASDPRRKRRWREFHAWYAHCKTDGIPTTRLWATHPKRARVDDLGFEPGRGPYYERDGLVLFNQWRQS
jgi:hypothetical protein